MFHVPHRFLILVFCCLLASSGMAQSNTQRGATVGGLTGAIAGSLIGDHNGEAGAGAAIGGVIGAVTGGLLGNATDKEMEYRRQQVRHQLHQQQLVDRQSSVSREDVISMSRSGLSDTVIINQINQRGVQQRLQVPDIIALHEQGVNEQIITAMQQAPIGPPQVATPEMRPGPLQTHPVITTTRVTTPVIVEEHYIVPYHTTPRFFYHQRRGYRHQRHHSGIHIRF